jgi:hypothetical protein
MKKILIGTTLAAFAFAPAMSWADCSDSHQSMASSKPADKADMAQAPAPSKASAPLVAKTATPKQVKEVVAKPATPSKTNAVTVVAKNN